jgi:iron-sulfur cluster insertion protein|tara:strand:- start:152 stop:499 length:348 start_codon:yes stop_codon:yes gene_type:complete
MELKTNKATPFQVTKDALNRLSLLKESEKGKYFRVYVTGGGCSGFQYGFKFDEFDKDEDSLLNFDSGVSIILDQLSYPYLLGSKIDFKEDLMGAKFTVENPNASSTCGCGASFSI